MAFLALQVILVWMVAQVVRVFPVIQEFPSLEKRVIVATQDEADFQVSLESRVIEEPLDLQD